ncbi:MAG: helix-turn-helix domain-containing protein [Candidatus Gastranaerophilaceae bacterium]
MDIKKLFGKKVKEKRMKLMLTQEELSEKIGISAKSLSQIELGNNFVSAENLNAICSALNTNPKTLFDFSDDNTDKFLYIQEKLSKDNKLLNKIYQIISIIE